jgi:NADH-quinone oxidoreductase subunit J
MNIAENVAFYILAATIVVSGIRVVTTKNVVHAALFLTVVLASVAGLFVLTASEFAVATQILVYIGAIVVLFLFGIMLTRAPLGQSGDLDNDQKWLALVVSLFFFGVLTYVLTDAFGKQKLKVTTIFRTGGAADLIFNQYLVPFEILSVLLLAALVGAVVLARRD